MVLRRDKELASSVMDEMLEYVDTDGIIQVCHGRFEHCYQSTFKLTDIYFQTYFDHRRPRFDPVVCVNALSLFYTHGRGHELHRTLQWVHEVLLNRAYLDGTRYYESAECFLYFVSRLLASSDDPDLHAMLKSLLSDRVQERIGAEGDALALAMRILVCDFVGIRNEIDLRVLLPLQCEDGGWEIGYMYKYGSTGIRIGNRGLTTGLAVKAVESMWQPTQRSCESPDTLLGQPLSHKVMPATADQRSSSLKSTFQWLWHFRIFRKAVEV
jgi:hypothetical protein